MTTHSTSPHLHKACRLGLILAMGSVARLAASDSTTYTFTTLAGASSLGSADGTNARFFAPLGVATDTAGNIYVADTGNHTIRKITPAGVVSTFAGAPGRSGNTDGIGSSARFTDPHAVALDSAGNIFVTDTGNRVVRKITPAGAVTTLAGQPGLAGTANGTGLLARFNELLGVAVAPSGDVFVTDAGNHNIRKITPAGEASTLPGNYYFPGSDPWDNNPMPFGSIAVDPAGNLFVSHCLGQGEFDPVMPWGMDYSVYFNGTITKITPAGVTSNGPYCWVQIYADPIHHPVRKEGSFFAGIAFDSTGTMSLNEHPIAFDRTGHLFLADTANNLVFRYDNTNRQDFAGLSVADAARVVDGSGTAARFSSPQSTVLNSAGDLFVADAHCIRKLTPAGSVALFAGNPDLAGAADGPSADARFAIVTGLAIDRSDTLYVLDAGNYTVRKVTPAGATSTLAGTAGAFGTSDGTGPAASFFAMSAIAVNSQGIVYVGTWVGLRKITSAGIVTTIPGTLNEAGVVDAAGTTAWLDQPVSLAIDQNDNLYVGDLFGEPAKTVIRKLAPNGTVSTLYTDTDLRLGYAPSLTVGADGNLFATNRQNHTVLKIVPGQGATLIAGLSGALGSTDGTGEAARFDEPCGIALSSGGTLYLASGTTIRKGLLATLPVFTEQPQAQSAAVGSSVTFSATATGQPAPTYQWQRNGSSLAGATTRTLTLNNVTAADAGNYTVVASSDVGQSTSNAATLTIAAATPPSTGGGGGGGALGVWALLVPATLGLGRWRSRQRGTT